MDGFLIFAGLLTLLTTGVHIVMGGRDVVTPLLEAQLEDEARYTLYVLWHFISVFFVFTAALFLLVGFGVTDAPDAVTALSSLYLLFGLVFLSVKLFVFKSFGLSHLPQWILLIPIGMLGLLS